VVKKHKVEFDAKRKTSKKVPVKFTTGSGERISFKAKKKVKEPVHVKFTARTK
jgi:hypothetical protein